MLKLRAKEVTFEEIAKRLGYKQASSAHKAAKRAMLEVIKEPAQDLILLELIKLSHLERRALAVLKKKHLLVNAGKVVFDGVNKLGDDAPTLKAIETLLKVSESRRKLLGLDSPSKVDMNVDLSKLSDEELATIAAGGG